MKKYLYSGVFGLAALSLVFLGTGAKTASAHGYVPHFLSVDVTNVTSNSAILYATVDSMHSSENGHAWFEYGTNPQSGTYDGSWGNKVGIRSLPFQGWTFMKTQINNLRPNTTYYFHVKAENKNGSNTGQTVTFRTTGSTAVNNTHNNNNCACDPQQNVYATTNNSLTVNTTTTVNNNTSMDYIYNTNNYSNYYTTNYTYQNQQQQNNYQSTGNQDSTTAAVYTYHY